MTPSLASLIVEVIKNGREGIIQGNEVVFPVDGPDSISIQFSTYEATRSFRNYINGVIRVTAMVTHYSKVEGKSVAAFDPDGRGPMTMQDYRDDFS